MGVTPKGLPYPEPTDNFFTRKEIALELVHDADSFEAAISALYPEFRRKSRPVDVDVQSIVMDHMQASPDARFRLSDLVAVVTETTDALDGYAPDHQSKIIASVCRQQGVLIKRIKGKRYAYKKVG